GGRRRRARPRLGRGCGGGGGRPPGRGAQRGGRGGARARSPRRLQEAARRPLPRRAPAHGLDAAGAEDAAARAVDEELTMARLEPARQRSLATRFCMWMMRRMFGRDLRPYPIAAPAARLAPGPNIMNADLP